MGEIKSLVILLEIFSVFTFCCVGPLIKSNGDLDSLGVESHILQLEQAVSALQSQLQTQEQKQAAVLSSVLSKLASTTDELTILKFDFNKLENNYSSSLLELSSAKHQLKELKKDHDLIINELTTAKDELNATSLDLQHAEMKIIALQNRNATTALELESIKRQINSTEITLTSNTQTLGQVSNNMISVVSKLVHQRAELNSTQASLQIVDSKMASSSSVQKDLQNRMKSMEGDVQSVHHTIDNLSANLSTYMFWAHIMTDSDLELGVIMYKEIMVIGKGSVGLGMKHKLASITTVTYLNKGNRVWLTKLRGGSLIYAYGLSSIGGTLLQTH